MRDLKWPVGATSYILETLIIPRFLVATTNSDEYGQISNTSLSTVVPKNVE